MRIITIVSVLMALPVAAALSVQEEQAMTSSERVYEDLPKVSDVVPDDGSRRPDYSREALLSAVWTDPYFDEDVPRAPKTFNPFQFTVFGQTFRFMPFLGSTGVAGSSAVPFNVVDPFAIAPVSAAYTPQTFRDRWFEWRLKRQEEKEKKKKGDDQE